MMSVALVPFVAAPIPMSRTALGRGLEAVLVVLRCALVLVPVWIVAEALRRARDAHGAAEASSGDGCCGCGGSGHAPDAAYCRSCGERLGSASGTRP